MDELIYRFLLDAGYPRAAIVSELELLGPAAERPDAAAAPDYAIVDPTSFTTLAVLLEVEALDDDELADAAIELGSYARQVAGRSVQGYVVRVDPHAANPDGLVQFYRVWPNETLERVSPQAFPDLDTLRTRRALAERTGAEGDSAGEDGPAPLAVPVGGIAGAASSSTVEAFDFEGTPGEATAQVADRADSPSVLRWVPGLLLAALAIADRLVGAPADGSLLGLDQSVLATGAGVALMWAGQARRSAVRSVP